MKPNKPKKTFKRETIIIMTIYLIVLTWYCVSPTDLALIEARSQILSIVILPITGLIGGCIGIAWHSYNSKWSKKEDDIYDPPLD